MSKPQSSRDHTETTGVHPLKAGLRAKCPRCGTGNLFERYINTAKNCPNCGLDYAFADPGDGPVPIVVLIVGFIILGAALYTEVHFSPPLVVHFLVWAPVAIALSLLVLRATKGVLIAIQYKFKAAQGQLDKS